MTEYDRNIMEAAFRAYYDEGQSPAEIASWLEQNASSTMADLFVTQWRHDEGEFDYAEPLTPDEWVAQRDADRTQLDRLAEQVEQNRLAESEAAGRRLGDAVRTLPLGEQLAPAIAETVQHLVEADPTADLVPIVTAAYTDATTRYEITDNANYHAEQAKPFRSTEMASGWLTTGERFPSAESVAAQREQAVLQREAELYQAHAPQGLARPTPPASEAEHQRQAAESFQRSNTRRNLVDEGMVKGPKLAGTKAQVAGIEHGRERSATFHTQSIEADIAAREGRQRKDFWNGTSDTKEEAA